MITQEEAKRSPRDVRALVVEWQEPVYHLAYRMLGNEADAADATQDIFATVLRKADRYDASREFRAWLYQVATREIYKFSMRRRRHSIRESDVTVDSKPAAEGDPVGERELRSLVQTEIGRLDEESRAPLALHFFSGLTQGEISAILDVPRTTIRNRIRRSIDLLRHRLRSAGYPVVGGGLEQWLTNLPAPRPPGGLQQALLDQVVSLGSGGLGGGGTAGAGLAIGGIGMKKMALIGLLFGIAGILVGIVVRPMVLTSRAPSEGDSRGASSLSGGIMREDYERLQAKLRVAEEAIRRLEDRPEVARAEGAGGDTGDPTMSVDDARNGDLPGGTTDDQEDSGIDWTEFSESFAAVAEFLAERLPQLGSAAQFGDMTPEEQAALLEFMAAARRVGFEADRISDHPFFDPTILGELLQASFARTLDLSPEQLDAIQGFARSILADRIATLDPAQSMPVESFRLRSEIVDALLGGLAHRLPQDRIERFEKLDPVYRNLLQGEIGLTEVGFDQDRAGDLVASSVEYQYALTAEQMESDAVQAWVREMMDGGDGILERYGQRSDPPAVLDSASRDVMNGEFLDLQIDLESKIVPLLSSEQLATMQSRPIHVIRFVQGDGFRNLPMIGSMF